MIKIDKIHIVKFRGILDLTIDLKGVNFAVCGPNGTGKSGVVDAIEFALSGDISRLSGRNRGSVSVKKHAPHVDFRDRPGDASVQLWGRITGSDDKFSITRTVEGYDTPVIEPSTSTVADTLAELGRHKCSTLSRRELIEYVLSTPGDRGEQVQALLQLDFLRDTRQTLQKISRARDTASKILEGEKKDAGAALAAAAGIPMLKSEDLLAQINLRRTKLELPMLVQLEAQTSVKDGLSVATEKTQKLVAKAAAVSDLALAQEAVSAFGTSEAVSTHRELKRQVEDLKASGDYEKGIDRRELLTRATELIEDDQCPVCDTKWKPEELALLITEKLKRLEGVLLQKRALNEALEPLATSIASMDRLLNRVQAIGLAIDPNTDVTKLEAASVSHRSAILTLREANSLDKLAGVFDEIHKHDSSASDEIRRIVKQVDLLPDTSERDAARDFLVEVDVRLNAYREASRKAKKSASDATTAKAIFNVFSTACDEGLVKIYGEVQASFADLYKEINSEDEADFEAEMPIQSAGVDLKVDFYGRGKFPPGAYHSEGHQDGMGLCLYLALMRHLYGTNFKFCVLDDVLMSVDGRHRRAVCAMLGKKFSDTQFIFTTHDDVWLRNMQSTGLVGSESIVHFRNWSVEGGPAEWTSSDIWAEINEAVSRGDIAGASGKMRNYLEYLSGEMCHVLGASVVYKGDHQYALGQLLPNAVSRLSRLFKAGKTSALSWRDTALEADITAREADFKAKLETSRCEQWGINATVHYNGWASLTKEDFQPIVNAFEALDLSCRCADCKSILFVSPHFGTEEMLRCKCGKVHINLLKNTPEAARTKDV